MAGARKLHEEVLAIRRQVLGPEHPGYAHLDEQPGADSCKSQGDFAGARKPHEEALEIRRRVQGPEHPDTFSSAWNLFCTLRDLGDREVQTIIKRDLLWLLDPGIPTLSALMQQKIREYVTQGSRTVDSRWSCRSEKQIPRLHARSSLGDDDAM